MIFASKPSWSVALFLLSYLNASLNSSSLDTVSFNVVFTVGRYDSKAATIHKIYETNSSFHVKQRTTGKV